ncbi:DUF4349 domain-containing protein [Microbacterium sp. NPDC076911]|uniref:DUF4349 domain-containing protein n=1 Tax=Microbacterium sp. NPDC076911 TaxID=3154958 RepID=UPI00344A0924
MTDKKHRDTAFDANTDNLPELGDERIDAMEREVFSRISQDRVAQRSRRGKWWIGGAAAAAVVVVAAVIAPSLASVVGDSSYVNDGSAIVLEGPGLESGTDSADIAADGADAFTSEMSDETLAFEHDTTGASAQRDIMTFASATVVVDDVPSSVSAIADAVNVRNGYVESMSIGRSGDAYSVDENGSAYETMPYPYAPDGAWITVRVPADELDDLIGELSELGDVTSSSISRQDVTDQTIDLRARIDSAQASVDRLTELMSNTTNIADLIAAESALSERQTMVESYQQQLESVEGQVAMSTLTVTLHSESQPVEADPAGFTDGVAAGWNGLIATLNGIMIALGFLLPWLLVLAATGLIVWAIVSMARSARKRSKPTSE